MEVIITHVNADFDGLSSMVAAKKLNPEAVMVLPAGSEKSVKTYISLHKDKLEIVTKLKNIEIDKIKKLIIVDTKSPYRIGEFKNILSNPDLKIEIYDHHPETEDDIKGERILSTTKVGATVTILIQYLKSRDIQITADEATLFAIGLYEETGSFSFTSTTPEDMKACAYLLEKGASLNVVMDYIKNELSNEQTELLDELLKNIETTFVYGIPISISTAVLSEYVPDLAVVAHRLKDMGNLDVLFILVQVGNKIYIVTRSRLEEVDVSKIVSEFGGGGHPTAASGIVQDVSIKDCRERLLKICFSKVRPTLKAKDIMSSPVITILSETIVEEARKILLRFNLNTLPVLENGKLNGIVTRNDLDKTIQHGYSRSEVKKYMSRDVVFVSPDASLSQIQKKMAEHDIGRVPVIDSGKIVGIITREDLLTKGKSDNIDRATQLEKAHAKVSNVATLLTEVLPPKILKLIDIAGHIAVDNGFTAYIAGGFVRDLLLKFENFDVDIVIEGDGIVFAEKFADHLSADLKKHRKFGTAIVNLADGIKIDIATARTEFYKYPGSMPEVEYSSIKYDLYRRDFTINAMAININPDNFGELMDYFSGQRDLRNKLIRVLYNMSFIEDPTRIFRAIKFEQRYGFKIEKNTEHFLKNAVELELIDKLAGQRIQDELIQILSEDEPLKALHRMAEFNVLKILSPNIKLDENLEGLFNELFNSFSVELLFIKEKIDRWLICFLVLIDQLSIDEVRTICNRLKFKSSSVEKIITGKELTNKIIVNLDKGHDLQQSYIYKELHNVPIEVVLFILTKSKSKKVKKRIHQYISQMRSVKPIITGEHLKELGMIPGPKFKEILSELLYAILDGKVKNIDEEKNFVRSKNN